MQSTTEDKITLSNTQHLNSQSNIP